MTSVITYQVILSGFTESVDNPAANPCRPEVGCLTDTTTKIQDQTDTANRPGIYITKIQNGAEVITPIAPASAPGVPSDPSRPDKTDQEPGLKIMQFPKTPEDRPSWHASSFDPSTLTTIEFDGKLVGTRSVNACHNDIIQGWLVELTNGTISSPLGRQVNFQTTYKFGTQYGGFSLEDFSKVKGATIGGAQVNSHIHSIINQVPILP